MNSRYYSLLIIAFAFLLQSCDTQNGVIVSGQVIEESTGNALKGVVVEIVQPENLKQDVITDSLGGFSFNLDISDVTTINILASKQGYKPYSEGFRATPKNDTKNINISLISNDAPQGGGNGGGGPAETVGGKPTEPAFIGLTSIAKQAINIKETGDNVSTAFTFTVKDSAGRTINNDGAVDVDFTILSGTGGDEKIRPETAKTSNGKVTTSLLSGNKAGPVKIQARITIPDKGIDIKSTPVLVAIHGGFPDADHFSIAPAKYNFEGYDFNNVTNTITANLGDKFSNPVKPGTVIYFSTSGGIIQGSGATDKNGIVTVDLISADPRPDDNISGSGGRMGYATVTATTVDENDNRISKDLNIVFSTSNALISANPTTFNLDPNGGESFSYTVTDLNGNPMAAGTKITVEGGDGIEVTGDTDLTLGNNILPGPGTTEFNFSIRDTDNKSDDPADLTLKITVTSPSGNETTYSGISGTRRKGF